MEARVSEQHTTAEEMARASAGGVSGKAFRARLRRELRDDHTFGSWKVLIGSEKYLRMEGVLKAMEARRT